MLQTAIRHTEQSDNNSLSKIFILRRRNAVTRLKIRERSSLYDSSNSSGGKALHHFIVRSLNFGKNLFRDYAKKCLGRGAESAESWSRLMIASYIFYFVPPRCLPRLHLSHNLFPLPASHRWKITFDFGFSRLFHSSLHLEREARVGARIKLKTRSSTPWLIESTTINIGMLTRFRWWRSRARE